MELKEVIGRRRSTRFLRSYKPVERAKLQKMLEAARLASFSDTAKVLVLQTVGYPAEDPDAGGQRPRLPFEELFSLNRCGEPFPREEAMVAEFTAAKMLRPAAPLSYRRAELRWLQEQYGLSEIFGDEVPEILNEMMGATTEDGDAGEQKRERP